MFGNGRFLFFREILIDAVSLGEKVMRKVYVFFVAILFLVMICIACGAETKGIDLTAIQTKGGFSFSDSNKAEWSYYEYAVTNGSKGGKRFFRRRLGF